MKILSIIFFYFFIIQLSYAQSLFNQGFIADKVEWPKTDFSKKSIELHEILSGGPPKDGIPAIDHPKFISIHAAKSWLGEFEPVIVVASHKTTSARAYPLQILMFHQHLPLENRV